jgi:hypothetical protein
MNTFIVDPFPVSAFVSIYAQSEHVTLPERSFNFRADAGKDPRIAGFRQSSAEKAHAS